MPERADTKRIDSLQDELAFFESKKEQLLVASEGKFALIKQTELVGVYDSEQEAYSEGVSRFGNEPFLIKHIVKDEPQQSIPALHFGVLRADT